VDIGVGVDVGIGNEDLCGGGPGGGGHAGSEGTG
jgi:hypothetical protein